MTRLTLSTVLGYVGLIPFMVPLYLMVQAFYAQAGLQSAAIFGLYAPYVFIAYSATILSFLGGTLWGQAQQSDSDGLALKAIVFSNALALAAWISLLMIYIAPLMTLVAVCLMLAGFLSLLVVERLLGKMPDPDWWTMRIQLTSMVGLAHVGVIAMMIMEL